MSGHKHQEKALTRPEWLLFYDNEMARRIYEMDWSKTPLGDIESWPDNLWRAVSNMLPNSFPTLINWGNDYRQFYNDAYIPSAGLNHPSMLGMPCQETWSEIWDTILLPKIIQVQQSGKSIYLPVQFFPTTRNGFLEELYTTAAFSPLFDEFGTVEGIQCTISEITSSIIGERRLRTLRDLSMKTSRTNSLQDIFRLSAEVFEQSLIDIPFSFIYLLDANEPKVHLVSSAGIQPDDKVSPSVINLNVQDANSDRWPLKKAMELGPQEIDDLESRFGKLPGGPWPESPSTALILPIASQVQGKRPVGFLIAGISPRLALDEKYREFLFLMVSQIASAIGNAQAYAQERKRAEALAELDLAKTTFFSNVSHEFRTPLTLILGLVEEALAEVETVDPQFQRERLQIISRNALRLLKLVNQLLDFSAIEANRVQAIYQPTDLSIVTTDLASMYRAAIEKSGMTLIVDCPPLPAPVYVDRDMWEKIVLNLLSNAFKHTFEGHIRVTLQQRNTEVILSIIDSGVGIPPEQLPHLFERFHRIPGARSRTHEGSGIGLALILELVKLHGGSISVDSSVNQGSSFTVSIPTGKAHLPAECIQEDTVLQTTPRRAQSFIEEALAWLPQAEVSYANGNNEGETVWYKNPEGDKARVLLVEDNADMRNYIMRLLAYYCEVEAVPDGYAALVAARCHPPDLILSDIMMPKLDGLQLLAALRNDPALRTIPVVLLSAHSGEKARVEGLQMGASDYLVKPFDKRELLARVKANLNLELHRITQEAEEARRLSEARFRRLVHSNIIGIFSGRVQDGKIIEANDYFLEMLGYSHSELEAEKLNWKQLTPPEYAQLDESKLTESIQKGYLLPFEKQFFHKDGHRVDVLLGVAIMENSKDDYICYVLDISKRKLMEQELSKARDRAEEANRKKSEFLGMMSHELRTPLNSIIGFSRIMEMGMAGPINEKQVQYLQSVGASGNHLLNIVNDLLDVAQIETGSLKISPLVFEVRPLLAEVKVMMEEFAVKSKVVLTFNIQAELNTVRADAGRLKQILINLISNAIKFNHEGGYVHFHLYRIENWIVGEIEDNGIGIPKEKQAHLFEKFHQVDARIARTHEGTGLGLALCKKLVELHGGEISINSEENVGTTCVIKLPY